MKEIANNIFIDQSYPGVVLGALKLSHGLLTVDAPFRANDQQSWRQRLAHLGGGIGQLMVMLDTQSDRVCGLQLCEYPVLAHANALTIIQNLPINPRVPEMQARSTCESHDQSPNVRWRLPDLTYSEQVSIHWDAEPVVISHHPGNHRAGSWVRYEDEKIIFIGDSVVIGQPPFLEWCHLDDWMNDLTWLSSEEFDDYQIISGRDGEIQRDSVLWMIEFLSVIKTHMDVLLSMESPNEAIEKIAEHLLRTYDYEQSLEEQFTNRLVWGLRQLLNNLKTSKADE